MNQTKELSLKDRIRKATSKQEVLDLQVIGACFAHASAKWGRMIDRLVRSKLESFK